MAMAEAPADLTERLVRRLARLPLGVRRGLLRLLFEGRVRTAGIAPPAQCVRIVERVLQLGRPEARKVAREVLFHDALLQMEWLALATRPFEGLMRDARRVTTADEDAFLWIAEQRGAVLATLHMGAYPLVLAWLLHRYLRGRRVIIVKSRANDADERQAVARLSALGVEVEFMAPGAPAEFHRLMRQVRDGAIAISLVDLPRSYGKSALTEFLSQPVEIAHGVSDLAAICGVPMLLFRAEARGGHDAVMVDAIIEIPRDARARDEAARRIGGFVSRALQATPAQWHLWPRFLEFLPDGRAG